MANTSNPQFPCQLSPVEAFEVDKKNTLKTAVSAALADAFEVNENVLILQNEDGKSFLFDTNTILSETAGITPTAIRKYCRKNGYSVCLLTSVKRSAKKRRSDKKRRRSDKKRRCVTPQTPQTAHKKKKKKVTRKSIGGQLRCIFTFGMGDKIFIKDFFNKILAVDLFGASQTNAGKMARHLICAIENAYNEGLADLGIQRVCRKETDVPGVLTIDHRVKAKRIVEIGEKLKQLDYDLQTIKHLYEQCTNYRQHERKLRKLAEQKRQQQ